MIVDPIETAAPAIELTAGEKDKEKCRSPASRNWRFLYGSCCAWDRFGVNYYAAGGTTCKRLRHKPA